MLGRTPGNIKAIRPLSDGVIADFQVTEKMLQHFIASVHEQRFIKPSPRILVCVPCRSTQVERRIRESVLGAGARDVKLIEELWPLVLDFLLRSKWKYGDRYWWRHY